MASAQAAELRARTDGELAGELEEAHQALFNLRFQAATRQLADVSQVGAARRRIARIKTLPQRAGDPRRGRRREQRRLEGTAMTQEQAVNRKARVGTVVSDVNDQTVVVEVERASRHRIYRKVIRRTKRYHVHDEQNEATRGDLVRIEECRPISKLKRWRLIEVLTERVVAEVSPDTIGQEVVDEVQRSAARAEAAGDTPTAEAASDDAPAAQAATERPAAEAASEDAAPADATSAEAAADDAASEAAAADDDAATGAESAEDSADEPGTDDEPATDDEQKAE